MALSGYSDSALGIGRSSGRKGKQLGGTPVSVPAPYSGGAVEQASSGATPGTFDINPLDPGGTAAAAMQEGTDWLSGLRNAVFGTSAPDAKGQHGGFLGDVPILGPGARALTETVANVGGAIGTVGKGALDIVGGVLEHVDLGSDETHRELQRKFDAVPDSPEKRLALEQIAKDPGATGHYMATVVKAAEQRLIEQGDVRPEFTTGAFHTPGSAAEAFDNLLGLVGLSGRMVERTWADIETPGQQGLDRLDLILAIGDGRGAFSEDKGLLGTGILAGDSTTGLNPIEAVAYQKVRSNEWTRAEAMDFLTAHNQGFSHSTIANIAGNVAMDPQTWGSLGFAGLGRLATAGGRIAAGVRQAELALAQTDSAIAALVAAERTASGARLAEIATEKATLIAKRADDFRAWEEATKGAYKIGGDVAGFNVLGHAARSESVTNMLRTGMAVKDALQAKHLGIVYKSAKFIVDPLSTFSLGNPFRKQMVDLMTEYGSRVVLSAYGFGNHAALTHALADLTEGASTVLADMFSEDIGTYSANLIRRVVARRHRDVALAEGLGDSLVKESVDDVIATAGDTVPRTYEEYVLREANIQRIRTWDDVAVENLADRLVDNYGVRTKEEWLDFLRGRNADEMSMLHAATYGRATKRLLAAVEEARLARSSGADLGDLEDKLNRLILINRTTLTQQGGGGILKRLEEIKGIDQKIEFIRSQQELYPELRGFTLDMTNPGRSVERFSDDLKRRMQSLPMQVEDDELAKLPSDLASLHTDKTYTLGFAPKDEYKWGLVRSNEEGGKYAAVYDVWVDHVAPGLGMGYRTVANKIEQNILGQPILGAGRPLAKGVDYIEAGIRTLNTRISGTVIAEAARAKFVANAQARYARAGVTDRVAKDIINQLEEAIGQQDIVVRPAGLTTEQMWNIAKQVIPQDIPEQMFGRRELLALVLEAYDGDMRFVGLTQKLSSRVKRVLSFSGNNASVLSEQVYPTLKYRLNMIFQAQEKAEPWVLNAFRGITPARSIRSLNEADKATQVLLERMAQHSLITNADFEMAEYAGRMLHGQNIEDLALASNTALGQITQKLGVDWAAIRDVRGMKQLNMLRTFRKGLAKDLRQAWEAADPGRWDDMYREYVRKAGRGVAGVDEDEFAVALMADKMLGSQIFVTAIEDRIARIGRVFDKVDYVAAIKPGEWMVPQTLGELRRLDLDSMASLLGFTTRSGKQIKSQAELRAAIAAGDLTVENVTTALLRYGADPDYAARVRSALEFSWTGFWDQVTRDYNLTPEQRARLESVIAGAAEMRSMTPIDYISQIMVPTIGEGNINATVGHLGAINDILNSAGDVVGKRQDLAQLFVPAAGAGEEAQLVDQLASIFLKHMDPSAKLALIEEFKPALLDEIVNRADIDMAVAERLWDQDVHEEFVRYLMGEINPPTDLIDAWEAGLLKTVDDWDRVDPAVHVKVLRSDGTETTVTTTTLVGDGLRSASPEVQRVVLRPFAEMHAQFPTVRVHIDLADDLGVFVPPGEDMADVVGITLETADGGNAVFLRRDLYGPDMEERWVRQQKSGEIFAAGLPGADPARDRETLLGAVDSFGGAEETVLHEMGHAIDQQIRVALDRALKEAKRARKSPERTKAVRALRGYQKFADSFINSLAARRLSEYGMSHQQEAVAELFALAFSKADPAEIDTATEAFARQFLDRTGPQVVPTGPRPWENPLTIKTVDEADEFLNYAEDVAGLTKNELDWLESAIDDWAAAVEEGFPAKEIREYRDIARERAWRIRNDYDDIATDLPDKISAVDIKELKGPQTAAEAVEQLRAELRKTGFWKEPPTVLDRSLQVRAKPLIKGTRGSANPDVIRAGQQFALWTRRVMGNHLRGVPGSGNGSLRSLMDKIDGIPTDSAVPYNYTQHMIMSTALENMRSKWDDAHRLQYYSRERTMLERSINHPMFGIYPASYMWGKMLPEVVRFLSKSPFGIRTGAAAYSTMDVMRDIAIQREFDPEFDAKIEALGHSPAMFALGYMIPSWPWEVSAAFATWSRELAQEGLDMQARVEGGGTVATDASSQGINVPQVLGKAADVMNPLRAIDRTIFAPLEEITKPKEEDAAMWYLPEGTGPVAGSELGEPMQDAFSELRDWLSGAKQ